MGRFQLHNGMLKGGLQGRCIRGFVFKKKMFVVHVICLGNVLRVCKDVVYVFEAI